MQDIHGDISYIAAVPSTIALPSSVTADTLQRLTSAFMSIELKHGASYILDAANTETISAQSVRLIVALSRALRAAGLSLKLRNHGGIFAQTFGKLGLDEEYIRLAA